MLTVLLLPRVYYDAKEIHRKTLYGTVSTLLECRKIDRYGITGIPGNYGTELAQVIPPAKVHRIYGPSPSPSPSPSPTAV